MKTFKEHEQESLLKSMGEMVLRCGDSNQSPSMDPNSIYVPYGSTQGASGRQSFLAVIVNLIGGGFNYEVQL